jgi:hypothetical protein
MGKDKDSMRYLIPLIGLILAAAVVAIRIFSVSIEQPSSAARTSANTGASDPSSQYLVSAPTGVPLDRNFDSDLASVRPADILSLNTGSGAEGTWLIQPDATAPSRPNVLAQISTDNTMNSFPIAVETKSKYQDLDLAVQIKLVDGQTDRSGGIIFRYQDAADYYLVRVNALEKQIGLYHVANGDLIPVAGSQLSAPPNGWHALRIIFKADDIQAFFDGSRYIDARDNSLSSAGLIGFWTHADSVAHFDDLVVHPAN